MGPWDLLLPAQHKGRILVIIVTSGLYIWTSYILGNKALLFPHTRAPHMDIHGDKHIGVFGKTWDGEDGGGVHQNGPGQWYSKGYHKSKSVGDRICSILLRFEISILPIPTW